MQSPTADAGQASEAATPGASVAAQHGGDRHTGSMFDTPGEGPPSPGQGSPAQHRSQEGRSNSRRGLSSTGPNLEAAAAVLASADGAAAPGPLTAPRLRVQGADIILEDASPKAADPGSSKQPAGGGVGNAAVAAAPAANDKSVQQAAAAGAALPANHLPSTGGQQQQPPQQQAPSATAAATAAAAQQQQQPHHPPPQQHHLVAAARASQSHELELQLRLASRTATGASNMALASSRPTQQQLNSGAGLGDDRWAGMELRACTAVPQAPWLHSPAAGAPGSTGRLSWPPLCCRVWATWAAPLPPYANPCAPLAPPPPAGRAATTSGRWGPAAARLAAWRDRCE